MMRTARRLLLLCIMALTAMALTAGNAAAQETAVEVEPEGGTEHCNPCIVHAESVVDSEIISHVFGHEEVVSNCHDEFIGEIYEDGTGHITHQVLDPPTGGGQCTQQPCETAGEAEWPILEAGELAADLGHMHVDFCLEDENGNDRHCVAEVLIEEGADHHLTFSTDQHCVIASFAESEVTGEWETEADLETDEEGRQEQNIEIMH